MKTLELFCWMLLGFKMSKGRLRQANYDSNSFIAIPRRTFLLRRYGHRQLNDFIANSPASTGQCMGCVRLIEI